MRGSYLKIAGLVCCWLIVISSAIARNEKSNSVVIYSLQDISITGHTNINSFFLKYTGNEGVVKSVKKDDISDPKKANSVISIPVNEFTFSNALMKKDFLKMIKAKEYAAIPIQFKGIKDPTLFKDGDKQLVAVDITIAGVTKSLNICCRIDKINNNQYKLSGSKSLLLTDFNLKPPTKCLGIVKVENEIQIEFNLKLDLGSYN